MRAAKLPDLQIKLQRMLQHAGAADGLIRLMPLFLGFLEHEDQPRKKTSPEAPQKLEALRAAAVTFAERIKDAEDEPMPRMLRDFDWADIKNAIVAEVRRLS